MCRSFLHLFQGFILWLCPTAASTIYFRYPRRKLSWELPTWSVNVMCRPNSESLITTHLFLIRHERNPTDFNYRYYSNISEVDALSRNHQLSLYISCGPPTLCITKLQHRAPEPRSQCLELVRTDSRRASHTQTLEPAPYGSSQHRRLKLLKKNKRNTERPEV